MIHFADTPRPGNHLSSTEDPGSSYGTPARAPEAVHVRFVDGPWHGRDGRYARILHLPSMSCPGGIYRFLHHEDDGVVYAFEPA
jgi:hypothetical protein